MPVMTPHSELLPEPLPADPLPILEGWMAEALRRRDQPNPNAMVLATAGPDPTAGGGESDPADRLSARVVLCKKIVPDPGYVVFYTNYLSRKGRQLTRHPRAAAVIHWDHLHRQVRIEGPVVRGPAADSDAYFASRPWQSRLGAWASAQSQPVASRSQLKDSLLDAARRFGTPSPDTAGAESAGNIPVPRPPHWGGYQLWIESVELWVEGEARIHDRARWTRTLPARQDGAFEPGTWTATRLQP